MLLLMQLELNGYADSALYARRIRDTLALHDGRAPQRRAIADQLGRSSLRG